MDRFAFFGILSFLFSTLAYFPYVDGVLRSKTRPTISTWISWTLMDASIFAGMIAQEEIAWQMLAYVLGSLVVVAVSIYKGASLGWKLLDTICVAIVIGALAGWFITGDAKVAIVLGLISAVVGSVPMLINTWKSPFNELLMPWILVLLGGICGIGAIANWTIVGAATPVTFLVIQAAFVLLIGRRFFVERAPA